jgi:hypothetical protein
MQGCQIFLDTIYQNGGKYTICIDTLLPNGHNRYQSAIICTYVYVHILNGQRIQQPFPFQGPPKFTQIGIYGLKICLLATLQHIVSVIVETPFFLQGSWRLRLPFLSLSDWCKVRSLFPVNSLTLCWATRIKVAFRCISYQEIQILVYQSIFVITNIYNLLILHISNFYVFFGRARFFYKCFE